MSETTPGPWRVVPHSSRRHWDNEVIVATVHGLEVVCNRPEQSREAEHLPNANLIAAAPDLLAACQSALSEAKERDEDMGANCWPDVAAAIAKATGTEPPEGQ